MIAESELKFHCLKWHGSIRRKLRARTIGGWRAVFAPSTAPARVELHVAGLRLTGLPEGKRPRSLDFWGPWGRFARIDRRRAR